MNARRQTGALMVITPLVITAILLFTALAIDGARLLSLRADMQSQVNAAATAAAGASQACGGEAVSMQTMNARALAAAQAQGFDGDASDLVVQAGVIEKSASNPSEVVFRPVTDIAQSNATRVSYSRDEPISRLLPDGFLDDVRVSVNSAVRKEVIASISAAGSTAGVDGGLVGALLGGILGQPGYTLDPTDMSSLGNTLFSVGDLLDGLGVGTLEDALPLGADELATAIRTVGGAATPAGDLATRLLSASGIETVVISDVISTLSEAEVPRDAKFRAYDLLVSTALNVLQQQQILSGSPLTITNLNALGLPLTSAIDQNSLTLEVYVNRPPTAAVGPARQDINGDWITTFYAPDISLEIGVSAELPTLNLLGLAEFGIGSLVIPLAVDLGGGQGALVSASCAAGGNNDVVFGMDMQRQAVSLGTGTIDEPTGDHLSDPLDVNIGTLKLLAGLITIDPIVGLEATIDGTIGSVSATETMNPAYPLYCGAGGCSSLVYDQNSGGFSGTSFSVQIIDLEILATGIDTSLANAILSTVTGLLNTVVGSLLETLVDPLAEALGVGIGGMQVTIYEASQSGSQLIENIEVVGN
ncbi:MAG: hypothetical protein EP339_11345 [Gammaproteobacteria bacterium]|nr:MAG: hypothetical protein EP339_11345 [Gammaproteobacteria bacterium]TNE95919.1 MAG: hypothetical protein EP328_09055 [Gammaproteobacteria bacterium]